MASELIAPITEDLRQGDNRMDIIKGVEHVNLKDEAITAAVKALSPAVEAGDWLVKTATGMDLPGLSAVAATFPVWVGRDQSDAVATGKVTLIVSGGFIYRTTKFAAGSYSVGQNLTVVGLGGGERVPSAAGGSDPVLARVYSAPDAQGVMEIQVLDR